MIIIEVYTVYFSSTSLCKAVKVTNEVELVTIVLNAIKALAFKNMSMLYEHESVLQHFRYAVSLNYQKDTSAKVTAVKTVGSTLSALYVKFIIISIPPALIHIQSTYCSAHCYHSDFGGIADILQQNFEF